jgi:L-fuculose-phosphate aldolase
LIEGAYATEGELRRELVRFSKWLSRLGFTPGTSGNLSVRLDEDRLLVTPTGMSKYLLKAADMVIVDLRGRLLAGTRKVTSEVSMHLAVYQSRNDVGAVIHSHPPIATGFACAGQALDRMLCQEAVMTLGVVPLARYATTGTEEVAASLIPFVPGHDAILLANHGAISYGPTLLEAFQRMETLEHIAEVDLVAHQLGTPRPLGVDQVEQLHRAKMKYLQNAGVAAIAESAVPCGHCLSDSHLEVNRQMRSPAGLPL